MNLGIETYIPQTPKPATPVSIEELLSNLVDFNT